MQATGEYGIGTRIFNWIDAARPEPFTTSTEDRRQLVVQVWYPSNEHGIPYPYVDNSRVLDPLAGRLHLPPWLLSNMQHAPTHAMFGVDPVRGTFPVLINPTGFSGFRAASLFWIEDLVSHGYIVVTMDQPGTAAASVLSNGGVIALMAKTDFDRFMPLAIATAPDATPQMNGVALPGGVVPFLAADMSFVLDQLALLNVRDAALGGTLDLDRVGIFGMSLGGYVAPEACHRDFRFKACLAVDAGKSAVVASEGLEQPLMLIGRDAESMREERRRAGGWPDAEIEHTLSSQWALFQHNRGDSYYVTMNSMYHVNWTDAPIWSPLVRWAGLSGPIDPYLGFSMTNACTLSFFDHYLKSDTTVEVCGAGKTNGQVQIEVRKASQH